MNWFRRPEYVLINDTLALTVTPETTSLKALGFVSSLNNTGNLVFMEAINTSVSGLRNLTTADFIRLHRTLDRDTVVLLPMANCISADWTARAGFLDALEPFRPILVSVGVQAPAGTALAPEALSPDCRRLLEIMRARRGLVGARGEMTRAVLRGLGIDATVIGCPSMQVPLPRLRLPGDGRPSLCMNNSFRGDLRETASRINGFARRHAGGFVCQNEEGVILDIFGIPDEVVAYVASQVEDEQHAALLRNRLFAYGYYNDGSCEWGELREWFVRHARVFFSMAPWRAYVGTHGLSAGPRFHGNVVALQAGVPAVMIPPDARVQEMVDFHGLASLTPAQFREVESPADLLRHAAQSHHLERQAHCRRQFREFLRAFLPRSRIHC